MTKQSKLSITYFNNCHGRNHVEHYGATAFFDLNTTGRQAKMASNLRKGDMCVVASYDLDCPGNVKFEWFEFHRESLEPDPDDRKRKLRVFHGSRLQVKTKAISMQKSKAARSKQYGRFFNRNGHFKRPSVV